MHELGILVQVIKKVDTIRIQNKIDSIDFIKLQVGKSSGVVPHYLMKLFPVAIDDHQAFQNTKLKIEIADGKQLLIKEIGYQ